MKVEYSLIALALAFVYALLLTVLPDFPLDEQTVLALLIYVLAKLGVEVTAAPVRRMLARFQK